MYVSRSSPLDFLTYYFEKFTQHQLGQVLLVFWELLTQYLPYLILSVFISAFLAMFLTPKRLEKMFCFNRLGGIIIASLLGTISPLSSYALIPFAGALTLLGLPIGAVSAFVLSTPLMNPTIFILTWRGLGWKMAVARVISTVLIGIISGVLADFIFANKVVIRENTALKLPTNKAFWTYVLAMTRYISKAFLWALSLASIIKVFLKPELVIGFLGVDKPWSIPLAALLGVPFYTCGGATIPIVSAMIDLGMSQSAALAFFIAGPATNLPNISAVAWTFNWYYLVFYLVISLSLAVFSGYFYSLLLVFM